MKRLGPDTLAIFLELPDEMWLTILGYFLPCPTLFSIKEIEILLCVRVVSWRLRRLTEQEVFPKASYLCRNITVHLNDTLLMLFKGLRNLRFSGSHVTFAAIQKMTWLNSLSIGDDSRELFPWEIQTLTHIKSLCITGGSEEHNLSHWTHLEHLSLNNNDEIDDSTLCHLSRLKSLHITGYTWLRGHSFSALQCLEKLELVGLCVEDNFFPGSLLATLSKSLTSLSLCECDVICDNTLTRLTNLRELCMTKNEEITGEALRKLTQLTSLDLEGDELIEDEDMACLTHLRELRLTEETKITGSFLKALTNTLSVIDIGCPLEYFSDLLCLRHLKSFSYFPGLDYTAKELETISLLKERGIIGDTYRDILK